MNRQIKKTLEKIYSEYHSPQYLDMDPLGCVHYFTDSADIEIAGLVASVLAYGRVEIIIRNIELIFDKISRKPLQFALNTSFDKKVETFKGFKHRFNSALDIALLFQTIAEIIGRYGSLGNCFASVFDDSPTIRKPLDLFVKELKSKADVICENHGNGFDYLLPAPSSGSACKRLNMYLRWMIRKSDSIDFGLWKSIPSSCLIIPVDTHIAKISGDLGFTKRSSADWKTAEEITDCFREISPDDPVKYDFALCRAGMINFRKDSVYLKGRGNC
jgi:uncharacterized protein (TIGR02757 family)